MQDLQHNTNDTSPYALTITPHPLNATLAATRMHALPANKLPPNTHNPTNPLWSKIAPPIGVPTSNPTATTPKLWPSLVPILSRASVERWTMMVGGRDTNDPEKKP
jgi:hypothetical protein